MNLLIPNLGSTSLKYQILQMPSEQVIAKGHMERVANYAEAIARIPFDRIMVDAIVLKAAHGGPLYRGTFLVDDGVLAAMRQFAPAAAVHNALYLSAIEAFRMVLPNVPIVASFEPQFHVTMPDHARCYGVPEFWRAEGVMRYGFHGASHEYIAGRMTELAGRCQRLVSCHLGGSSSLCAIVNGQSIDTTMGFSPQSGLENATRPGDIDIFAVLYMMDQKHWTVADVRRQLTGPCGLAGISGIEGGDVRDLETAAAGGNDRAALALDVFAYQVRKAIGAFAAAMGGLDAISFTGGIGENSARLRAACCEGLSFLGLRLDPAKNTSGSGDRIVSRDDSLVSVWAITTNEELVIARRALRLLAVAATR